LENLTSLQSVLKHHSSVRGVRDLQGCRKY